MELSPARGGKRSGTNSRRPEASPGLDRIMTNAPKHKGGRGHARRGPITFQQYQLINTLNRDRTIGAVVLVGLPGSGKSTFAKSLGWHIVNQDNLGSRRECELAFTRFVCDNKRVVVDRCNFNAAQRKVWVDLWDAPRTVQTEAVEGEWNTQLYVADKVSSRQTGGDRRRIAAVCLLADLRQCQENVMRRDSHPTLPATADSLRIVQKVARDLRQPYKSEGFDRIYFTRTEQ